VRKTHRLPAASKSAHRHARRQIAALDKGSAAVLWVGIASKGLLLGAYALGRPKVFFPTCRSAVDPFHQGKIHVARKSVFYSVDADLVVS
jgi:hypothetical protein